MVFRAISVVGAVGVCLTVAAARTAADDSAKPKTIIISGGKILTMSETGTIDGGMVVIREGKVSKVGPGRPQSMMGGDAKEIDASGKYVTPGFIDAWTDLGVKPGGQAAAGNPTAEAGDGFDWYDRHLFEQAWRGGVTAICIEPAANRGIVGGAALVRLADLKDLDASTTRGVSLVARLGIGTTGPLGRVVEWRELHKAFQEARDYREAWEAYEEELEQYRQDLKAGKVVKLPKKGEPAGPGQGEKGQPPPPSGRSRGSGDQDSSDLNEAESSRDVAGGGAAGNWADGAGPGQQPPATGKAEEQGKAGEITKPERPPRDWNKETLVRALKRELPVRFEVHRPADILNVLELAGEFNLDAVIEGASGGRYTAKELAEARVPVVLGQAVRTGLFETNQYRDHDLVNAGRLDEAGVQVVVASGRSGGGSNTHYLRQNAALWVGHGLDTDEAMKAVTIGAARACGADKTIGSLEVGKAADIVIWSGHPLASDSVVERVFVGGKQVYRRGK